MMSNLRWPMLLSSEFKYTYISEKVPILVFNNH